MAPHDRPIAERSTADHPATVADGADEGSVDRAVTTVKHGIDQVADKVKALLRPDR